MLAKIGGGHLMNLEERFPKSAVGVSVPSFALLGKRHAELLGEHPHGVLEPQLFMKLEELEHVAAHVAAKAVKEPLLLIHMERRSLLGVERTEPLVGLSRALERDILLHDLQNIGLQSQTTHD